MVISDGEGKLECGWRMMCKVSFVVQMTSILGFSFFCITRKVFKFLHLCYILCVGGTR